MKIIGRKKIADSEVGPAAKQRLALWVRQLSDAQWETVGHIRSTFPAVKELGGNRLAFSFEGSGVEVIALTSLDLGIFYIDQITQQEVPKNEK